MAKTFDAAFVVLLASELSFEICNTQIKVFNNYLIGRP